MSLTYRSIELFTSLISSSNGKKNGKGYFLKDPKKKKKLETDEKPEYPGHIRHLYDQVLSDVESVRQGKIPRPIKYKEDERPEYPGLIKHLWNQFWADVKSVREGKIPKPIEYKKKGANIYNKRYKCL